MLWCQAAGRNVSRAGTSGRPNHGRPKCRVTIAFWKLASVTAGCIVFAVAIRMPSCGESFWLDELHSAWVIWNGPSEIAQRAQIGNQNPTYFWGLWGWRQLFGDSERVLRASSVFAVAISIAIVTRHFGRTGKGVLGMLVAGAVLAVERQSLFYGTELRPYAWLLPLSALMVTTSMDPTQSVARRLTVWTLTGVAAMHLQPTSLPVWLGGMVVILIREPRTVWFHRTTVTCLVAFALSAFPIVASVATTTWALRQRWAAFAKPDEVADLWQMWPTIWVGVVPAGMLAITWFGWSRTCSAEIESDRFGLPHRIQRVRLASAWLFAAVAITTAVFSLAWTDLLTLWHPRYLLSLLPILAVVTGHAIDTWGDVEGRSSGLRRVTALSLASLVVIGLVGEQRTWVPLSRGQTVLVVRGEDWRAAAAGLRRRVIQATTTPIAKSTDETMSSPEAASTSLTTALGDVPPVFVDSGLVEAAFYRQRFLEAGTPLPTAVKEYLTFPFRGPYEIGGAELVPMMQRGSSAGTSDGPNHRAGLEEHYLVYRVPVHRIELRRRGGGSGIARAFGFGNLTVISVPGSHHESSKPPGALRGR